VLPSNAASIKEKRTARRVLQARHRRPTTAPRGTRRRRALAAAGLLELAKFAASLLAERLLVVGRFLVDG